MNWKLRLKNKTTLATLIVCVLAFAYQVMALFGVVPSVSQDEATQAAMLFVNALCALGIVVDPTTYGITDSTQALTYEEPKKD